MGIEERRYCYGRNDFKKGRRGITYHIEGTASCSVNHIETVIWWIEVVPAVACFRCKGNAVLCGDSRPRLGGMQVEDLLSKIYDKVAFYEKESMCLGMEFDTVVEEALEALKADKTEAEIEEIKELIYKISYSAQKNGFRIGVSFVIKFMAEICGVGGGQKS